LLVGTTLEWGLLGILTLQVYTFYTESLKERLGIKILVYTLFALSITHSIIAFTWTWKFLVSGWGQQDTFLIVPWQASAHTILSGTMTMTEQLFFCWRLWAFNSRNVLIRCVVVLVVMISLMQAGASYYGGIIAAQSATLADIAALNKVATIWLSGGFVGDIIVAASMITVLHIAGNDAFSKQTRAVLQKLILRVIETGSITAIAALLVLVLFQHFKTNYTYLSVAFLLCNLYSIVVLANINGRKSMALVLTRGSTSLGYASGRHEEARSHELAFRRPADTTIDDAIPDTTSVNTASEREHLALSLSSPKADWCINDSDKSQTDTNKTS